MLSNLTQLFRITVDKKVMTIFLWLPCTRVLIGLNLFQQLWKRTSQGTKMQLSARPAWKFPFFVYIEGQVSFLACLLCIYCRTSRNYHFFFHQHDVKFFLWKFTHQFRRRCILKKMLTIFLWLPRQAVLNGLHLF